MSDTPTTRNTLTLAELAAKYGPRGTKAAIFAVEEIDQSDIQTDYFNVTHGRRVLIGWRTGSREDFRQLRAAAARFPETEDLGPGCDVWTARVVQKSESFASNGTMHHPGDYSHGHDYENGGVFRGRTEEEVRAFVDACGEPYRVIFRKDDGTEITATYEWSIGRESIEHRDNYSMGSGNYLKAGAHLSTGWIVRSDTLDYSGHDVPAEVAPCALERPAPAAAAAPGGTEPAGLAFVRLNTEKNGVEVRFPLRPPEGFTDRLKALKFRWSRFSRCWYARQTTDAIAAAGNIVDDYNAQLKAERALDAMERTFTPEQDGAEAPGTI